MAALVAAARKEGTLNVIALPASWANYGAIIKRFTRLYGITVHSIAPGDRSQQEVAEIRRDAGTGRAADVLDVDMRAAVADRGLFAPYRVATWQSIPAGQKAPDGAWVQDYGGYMSVGYNSARFGTVTSLRQLLGRRFSRAVALDGNPAQANAALYGVMMANLARGGSPGRIAGGVAFFRELRAAGNFVSVPATTPLTIEAGSTPVAAPSPSNRPRRSTPRRRIRPPPACGRSSSTRRPGAEARTCGWRAASGRSSRRR